MKYFNDFLSHNEYEHELLLQDELRHRMRLIPATREVPPDWEPKSWAEFFQVVTYKPGWSFGYFEPVPGVSTLRANFVAPNSYRPDQLIQLTATYPIVSWDHIHSFEQALDIFRNWVKAREDHESDEWIQVKGKMVFDPHKG